MALTPRPIELSGDATEPSRPPDPSQSFEPGAALGRYLVVRRLGAGGMGVVFAAYDPQLDRKVAIKLLRADSERGSRPREHTRLLREAQALARLAHPNVVAVHDVGTHGDRVWLAMEFVGGQTLSAWRHAAPRSWREIVDVIVQAGRGLAAAHQAGLVHRDVKPENIMVDADTRVRVMDFGLARAITGPDGEPDMESSPVHEAFAMPVTVAGALVGTPPYMAPEQLMGAPADAKSDQFGLCVTAWEALFGERPFDGDTFVAYAANVMEGRVRIPAGARAVPRWLRRVLERGLVTEPSLRWPSIEAMLAELGRVQTRARRRWLGIGGAVGLAAVAAFAGQRRLAEDRQRAACAAEGAAIRASWNDEIAERVRAAFVATDLAHAAATYEHTVPWLAAYAEQWQAARTSMCVAATVDGSQPSEVHALGRQCLDDRQVSLAALVDVLQDADAEVVASAVAAASSLELIGPCTDETWLRQRPREPHDDAARETARIVRSGLLRVRALDSAGREQAAVQLADELFAAHSEAIAGTTALAELRMQIGQLASDEGLYPESETQLVEAFLSAVATGADEIAIDAATELAFDIGHQQFRVLEGMRWARIAITLLQRLGDADELRMASAIDALANLHHDRGEFTQAREHYEQVLAMREHALGSDHPYVAQALSNLGQLHRELGRYDEAEVLFTRAVEIQRRTLGPEHPDVASGLNSLGVLAYSRGDYERAQHELELALAIAEKARGPDHVDAAVPLNSLAAIHHRRGDLDEATAMLERVLAIFSRTHGASHPNVATVLANLARIDFDRERIDDARPRFERALAIREATLGPDHPDTAEVLLMLARIELRQGRPADALPLAERSHAIRERGESTAYDRGWSRFVLADVLVAGDGDRTRAITLARQAIDAFAEAGADEDLQRIERWLAAHGER